MYKLYQKKQNNQLKTIKNISPIMKKTTKIPSEETLFEIKRKLNYASVTKCFRSKKEGVSLLLF